MHDRGHARSAVRWMISGTQCQWKSLAYCLRGWQLQPQTGVVQCAHGVVQCSADPVDESRGVDPDHEQIRNDLPPTLPGSTGL